MLHSGFIPFYTSPTSEQLRHIDAWIRALPCCAVVTTEGVNYVGQDDLVARIQSFVDGFNYMTFKLKN